MKSLNEAERQLLVRGIPDTFIRATWKDFDFSKYVFSESKFKKFIKGEERERGYFLTGSCGSGKTFLASLIGKYLVLNGFKCLFRHIRDLKNEYLAAVRGHNKIDMLDKYSNVDYLILNDLGAEKLGEGAIECIYSILDNRELKNRYRMIITSNLDLNEIESKVMDRIPSRIMGLCGDPIVFPDVDWRVLPNRYEPKNSPPVPLQEKEKEEDPYNPTALEVQTMFDKLRGGNLNFRYPMRLFFMKGQEDKLRPDQKELL